MKKSICITIDASVLALVDVQATVDSLPRSQYIEAALRLKLRDAGFALPGADTKKHRKPKGGRTVNLEKEKPWIALGISRRTWYRKYGPQVPNEKK